MSGFIQCLTCQAKVRGPNLEFEHLEKELSNSSVWPPLGKNNDIKVGESKEFMYSFINVNVKLLFNVYLYIKQTNE